MADNILQVLIRARNEYEGEIGKFNRALGEVGKVAAVAAAAVAGASLVVGKLVFDTANATAKYEELRQAIGSSVEDLSRLDYAATQNATSLESMQAGLRILSRTARDAADGSKEAAEAFADLGVSVTDGSGQLKGASELFLDVAEAIAQLPVAERAGAAMSVLGRSAGQLVPLLALGRSGIEQFMQAADRLGITVTTKAGKIGDDLSDLKGQIQMQMAGIRAALLEEVGPIIQQYATAFSEQLAKAAQYVREHRAEIEARFKAIAQAVEDAAKFVVKYGDAILVILSTGMILKLIVQLDALVVALKATALWQLAAANPAIAAAVIAGIPAYIAVSKVVKDLNADLEENYKAQQKANDARLGITRVEGKPLAYPTTTANQYTTAVPVIAGLDVVADRQKKAGAAAGEHRAALDALGKEEKKAEVTTTDLANALRFEAGSYGDLIGRATLFVELLKQEEAYRETLIGLKTKPTEATPEIDAIIEKQRLAREGLKQIVPEQPEVRSPMEAWDPRVYEDMLRYFGLIEDQVTEVTGKMAEAHERFAAYGAAGAEIASGMVGAWEAAKIKIAEMGDVTNTVMDGSLKAWATFMQGLDQAAENFGKAILTFSHVGDSIQNLFKAIGQTLKQLALDLASTVIKALALRAITTAIGGPLAGLFGVGGGTVEAAFGGSIPRAQAGWTVPGLPERRDRVLGLLAPGEEVLPTIGGHSPGALLISYLNQSKRMEETMRRGGQEGAGNRSLILNVTTPNAASFREVVRRGELDREFRLLEELMT